MKDIFLSYASDERKRIKPLTAALENIGFSVWWDRELLSGDSYRDEITQALDTARCVVVIWSKKSIDSRWVRDEANKGAQRNVLVPVMIDKVAIPLGFGEYHTSDLSDWKGQASHLEYDRFLKSLINITGRRISLKKIAERSGAKKKTVRKKSASRRKGKLVAWMTMAIMVLIAIAGGWIYIIDKQISKERDEIIATNDLAIYEKTNRLAALKNGFVLPSTKDSIQSALDSLQKDKAHAIIEVAENLIVSDSEMTLNNMTEFKIGTTVNAHAWVRTSKEESILFRWRADGKELGKPYPSTVHPTPKSKGWKTRATRTYHSSHFEGGKVDSGEVRVYNARKVLIGRRKFRIVASDLTGK